MHSSRDFFGRRRALAGFMDGDYGRAVGQETQVALDERVAGRPGCLLRRNLMLAAFGGAAALAIGTRGACAQQEMSRHARNIRMTEGRHYDVRHLHAVHFAC
jgi:hypothetical protein